MPAPAAPSLAGNARGAAVRLEFLDARLLVLMRCVLAVAALAIVRFGAAKPARLVVLTYVCLGLYCLYSAALAYVSYRSAYPAPSRAHHWIDIAFYAGLACVTEGTQSIFFYFFFYAILVASLGWGFREGMAVTVALYALFTMVGTAFAPKGVRIELETLIRAAYLFLFGCVIAYLGGNQIRLRRRLNLLKAITNASDPRFGTEEALGRNLERLLAFYGADSCVLVLKRPGDPPSYLMVRAAASRPGQSPAAERIPESAGRALLALPETVGAVYWRPHESWLVQTPRHFAFDFRERAPTQACAAECEALANLLDARAMLTAPYAQANGTRGRIFVTSSRQGFFASEIEFLAQASDALAAALENIVLTEEHVSKAAEDERAAISRDLHDTTIQPYIAMKIALEALEREADAASPLSRRIADLVELAGTTVDNLRGYTARLRQKSVTPAVALPEAVRKHATQLARYYGIAVDVASEVPGELDERLAAEAFQIVSEALSNVLRHTDAKSAFVNLSTDRSSLLVEVGNSSAARSPASPAFMPRSIEERARALGGRAAVERRADGYTVVRAALPL